MRLRLSAAVGAVTVLIGLTVSFQQGLAAAIPASWAFVLAIAVIAGFQTVSTVLSRRRTTLQETETGDPERRYEAPRPGDELAETFGIARQRSRADSPRTDGRTQDLIRHHVAETAITAVADAEGCSEAEAHDRVERGEWTDDPVAAWFLGDDVGLPTGERARLLASAPFSQFEAAFSRTIRAIERVSGRGDES